MPEPRQVATTLEGRSSEQERVEALLARAAGGEPQTILVVGSAGVGKTTLVEATVAEQPEAIVAEGNCLPLVSVTIPFMAIRGAIASVPAGRGAAATIVTGDESATPGLFDGWLDTLCADQLAVLVIEDLHWADQHTLDALMYVISGPAARRLAVVGTLRDDELGDGHPLQRWLADVRRMPRVTELTLGPLDRVATGDQVAALLGGSPHQALVEDVQRRSGGNPLLTRLLVEGLSPDALRAPDTIPSNLRSAVLQSWFRLPSRTREVVTTLAVGSGPMSAGELAAVVGEDEDGVRRHLTVGVAAGTLEPRRGGTFWFRHPLNAEILEEAVPQDVRARWHAAFADLLERRVHDGSSSRIAAIAEHRLRAGDAAAAYRWAVLAATEHEAVGAHLEAVRMLRRALELHEQRGDAPESVRDLLDRLQTAAGNAGAHNDELEAVEAILALVSPTAEPLTVAGLLIRRMHLRFSTGKSFLSQEEALEAVRLSAVAASSPEHALALAELAHAAIWHGDPEGPGHAEHALAVARAAGDDRALAFALAASGMAAVNADHVVSGQRFAEEAFSAGLRARAWWGCTHAALWEANAIDTWACEAWADALRSWRAQLSDAGAPHAYLAWISASEAGAWLAIGDWRQCQSRLRDTLAAYPGPLADASGRLAAARLATWQGRQHEAEQHLARADELVTDRSRFLAFEFDAVRAEVKLGARDAEGALQACLTGLPSAAHRRPCASGSSRWLPVHWPTRFNLPGMPGAQWRARCRGSTSSRRPNRWWSGKSAARRQPTIGNWRASQPSTLRNWAGRGGPRMSVSGGSWPPTALVRPVCSGRSHTPAGVLPKPCSGAPPTGRGEP